MSLVQDEFDPPWIGEYVKRVLPPGWRLVPPYAWDGAKYERMIDGTTVIMSGATELDGRRWLHVSLANPRRLPPYRDIVEVKELFIGRGKKAIQVFPPRAEHVNIHPNCLHLWHCVDGDPLPDFTRGGKTL